MVITRRAASRRPGPSRGRGVVAAGALALLLGACGGPVEVAAPALDAESAAACDELLGALPDDLAGLEPREVSPADAPARAWGEGLVLTCGVEEPPLFRELIAPSCDEIVGVGWFFPPADLESEDGPVTGTTIGYRPRVEVLVPDEYRGGVSFTALSELAAPITEHLELVQRCR
ncbi:hypothetical protein BKA08_002543 [Nocardioides marinisabuli]|uniref:DUF3515 domain-containing protein n=1 Tax=Nocardioides marinisabuli TaxID=419476 RepID=A0A7Y9F292_9ACTN|nr:hypothetical protein [Nocardioides marinisabuli]